VFAELADRRPVWKQALEGWNVQQSIQVLEWQAEGEKKGMAESILRVLRRRSSSEIPPDVEVAIRRTQDQALLDSWLDMAATATSIDEFRQSAKL